MKHIHTGVPILATLISTRNRPELLNRALESVWNQTIKPNILVLIDDARKESGELSPDFDAINAVARQNGIEPILLSNRRSSGLSGACNTGLDELQRRHPAEQIFVAVLDDDDTWKLNHLEVCLACARERDAHMVISGIIRFDDTHTAGHEHAIPDSLNVTALLTSGQHIQGSNLFLRLDKFLEAGMFSEDLNSCTDRDLCLKLEELGNVRVVSTGVHTVIHNAHGRPDRCSTANSPQKLEGLSVFYRKWQHRMSPEEKKQFTDRSKKLFGWNETAQPEIPLPLDFATTGNPFELPAPVTLVVGTTTDSSDPRKIAPLLEWLCELNAKQSVCRVLAVIIENGPRPTDGSQPLRMLVESISTSRLHCIYVDHERQSVDASSGLFEINADMIGVERQPIAITRTLVAVYIAQLAKQPWGRRGGEVWAWVLDDEYRPVALVDNGEAVPNKVPRPDFNELFRLKAEGADVVLGQLTDAASIPALATVRTQLLDLKFALQIFDQNPPDEPLPNRTLENRRFRAAHADYYYDSARSDCAHLESPMWLSPHECRESCHAAGRRLAEQVGRIAAGEQIFRPLWLTPREMTPLETFIQRGGSALFFNPDNLVAYPNLLAKADGVYTRRSDMVATILGKACGQLKVVRSWSISGQHDRKHNTQGKADFDPLVADVQGFALYSALRELFEQRKKTAAKQTVAVLDFSAEEVEATAHLFQKYLEERTEAITLSFWRSRGIAKALRRLCAAAKNNGKWWGQQPDLIAHVLKLCDWVENVFAPASVEDFRQRVVKLGPADWRDFLAGLKSRALRFEVKLKQQAASISDWIATERCRRAEKIIAQRTGLKQFLLLGQGGEGVVFAHGDRCFKLLDSSAGEANWTFLRSKIGAWKNTKSLYPLQEWHDLEKDILLVYPFEPSEPYQGGHGPDLVRLLQECRQCGIVCRNLHPKNLRVTADGLRLIDYGADIVPFNDREFRMMCKRAWLTWRWHHREDLSDIMRLALTRDDLPELVGFQIFELALKKISATDDLHALIEHELVAINPLRVFDYGCGKGKLMERLARHDMTAEGYDPDSRHQDRWRTLEKFNPTLTFSNQKPQPSVSYDAVVCSLVLCDIANDTDYHQVIRDLRGLVTDSGTVFVAVCNPFFNFSAPTPFHIERNFPAGAIYERRVNFHECVSGHSGSRLEAHRPYRTLVRDLLAAGLQLEYVCQTETVDLERFEPASDFLLLRLKPLPQPEASVSLLIKSCAMEARTIEKQVQHLVRQLESPQVFCERILVVDSRQKNFLRQYSTPEPALMRQACQRLLDSGWIDRVLQVPDEPDSITSLNHRWFGIESSSTHTPGEAHVAPIIFGFEACKGDYVLHVDSDVIICRENLRHDFLKEKIAAVERDPLAVTVALNIAQIQQLPYSHEGPDGPWRVESRAGVIHRKRLLSGRPYPNQTLNGKIKFSWHRSLDLAVKSGKWRSYRGGNSQTCFIHPPNQFKAITDDWMLLIDRAEKCKLPPNQVGQCDLKTGLPSWLASERNEPFVFVICGRDVPPGRFWNCINSVLVQTRQDWGAIVIDDNSSELTSSFIEFLLSSWPDRFTLVRPRQRRGLLANTVLAIRNLCGNPESVIVTLDADDSLLGCSVLERVAVEYNNGADVTVGSMLRTDKHKIYFPNLDQPRSNRGGNVWQHLRTFKKYLFDQIADDEMQINGSFLDKATDWAIMLPIVEMARKPVYIPTPLYLHEPSDTSSERRYLQRLPIIEHLTTLPPRSSSERQPCSQMTT